MTFYCLSSIKLLGRIDNINREKHANWIKKQLTFRVNSSKEASLAAICYGLESLAILETIATYQPEEIAKYLINKWRASKQKIPQTFWFIRSLRLLGDIPEDIETELKEKWILEHAAKIRNISIENMLESFWIFAQIVSIIECEDTVQLNDLIDRTRSRIILHAERCFRLLAQ
jgi:prenyltransferase beta subunit